MKVFFRRFLSVLLSVLIVASMVPLTLKSSANNTNADEDNEEMYYIPGGDLECWFLPDGSKTSVDHNIHTDEPQMRYYCIEDYNNLQGSTLDIYRRALTSKHYNVGEDREGVSESENKSMLETWANIADKLIHSNDEKAGVYESIIFDMVGWTNFDGFKNVGKFLASTGSYYWSRYGGDYDKHVEQICPAKPSDEDFPNYYDYQDGQIEYWFSYSGLQRANSLSAVRAKSLDTLRDKTDWKKVEENTGLTPETFCHLYPWENDTTTRDVFYTMFTQGDKLPHDSSFPDVITFNCAILAFYDFELKHVYPDHYYTALDELDDFGIPEGAEDATPYYDQKAIENGGTIGNYSYKKQMNDETHDHIENQSLNTTVEGDRSYSYTYSESLSTTLTDSNANTKSQGINGGVSYTHTWGLAGVPGNIVNKHGNLLPKKQRSNYTNTNSFGINLGGNLNWSNCHTTSTANANTTTTSETNTFSISTSPLSPHTGTDITLGQQRIERAVRYNGPMCVTCKVAVAVSCSSQSVGNNNYKWKDPKKESQWYDKNKSCVFTFGETTPGGFTETDAVSHLYNLYNDHRGRIESLDSQSVYEQALTNVYFWDWAFSRSNPKDSTNTNWLINWPSNDDPDILRAAYNVPMVDAEATTHMVVDETVGTQGSVYPLYPLNTIKADNYSDVNMDVNSTLDINSVVNLTGYDYGNGPTDVAEYYGFSQDLGSWVLCDEAGNELSDQNNSVITISDRSKINSGGSGGEVYIKYKIDENCYHAYYEKEGNTQNIDLKEVPIIKVIVKAGTNFTGTLKVYGDLTLTVGTPIDLSSSDNTLQVYTVSDNGQQVLINNEDINWYNIEPVLQQDANNPDVFTPTAEGDYHIGIEYGGVSYVHDRIKKEYGYPITVVEPEGETTQTSVVSKTGNNTNNTPSNTTGNYGPYLAKFYKDSDQNQVVNWVAIYALDNVARVLDRAYGKEPAERSQTDVYASQKYLDEIGVIDSSIDPNADLLREDFAKMCYDLANVKGKDTSAQNCIFNCEDVSEVSKDSYDAVNFCVSRGIIKLEDNKINPKVGFTRQEFMDSIKQIYLNDPNVHVRETNFWKEALTLYLYLVK